MTLRVAAHQFAVAYQLKYEEGNDSNLAVRIIRGANIYRAIQPPAYVLNTYGPLAYYLISLLVKCFGPAFQYPRVVICIMGLIIAAQTVAQWTGSISALGSTA